MNDRFSAKHRSYHQILVVLKEYDSEWKGLTAFSKKVELLQSAVSNINLLNTQMQQGSAGQTQVKDQNLEDMIFQALQVAYALKAYAHDHQLLDLEQEASVERSTFVKAKESDADDIALHIHQLATAHIVHLADYGIGQAEVDALASTIQNFTDRIGQPKQVINKHKVNLSEQAKYFNQAEEALKKGLDNLIFPFLRKNKRFYDAYETARAVPRRSVKEEEVPAVG